MGEIVKGTAPMIGLDICKATTQGYTGYMIQNVLANCLRKAVGKYNMTTVVTQVILDKDNCAFENPGNPIGPFFD